MKKKGKKIIILDAYNVIHRVPELKKLLNKDLATAREGLIRFCSNWLATRKDFWLFYLVFDGQSGIANSSHQPASGMRAIYTQTGEKADTRIIQIVEERSMDCHVTVVSDDNFVRKHSSDLEATIMTVDDFFATPTANRSNNRDKNHANDKHLTPKQIKDINTSLMDEWDIT